MHLHHDVGVITGISPKNIFENFKPKALGERSPIRELIKIDSFFNELIQDIAERNVFAEVEEKRSKLLRQRTRLHYST